MGDMHCVQKSKTKITLHFLKACVIEMSLRTCLLFIFFRGNREKQIHQKRR